MIKSNFFLASSFLIFSIYSFGEIVYQFEDIAQEKRFYSLISEIRCPKCTSGSIASSDAPVSRDLKNKVYDLIIDGSSDDEIKSMYQIGLVIFQIIDRLSKEQTIYFGLDLLFSFP